MKTVRNGCRVAGVYCALVGLSVSSLAQQMKLSVQTLTCEHRKAVWPRPVQLSLNEDGSKDAIKVQENGNGDCTGITVHELMEQYYFPHLDIFKCDIVQAHFIIYPGSFRNHMISV